MPHFDKFDICEAYFLFASLYHGGQGSKEYFIFTRLHRLGFSPRPNLTVESLSENGREIFDGLVARIGFEPYPSDRRKS